MRTVLEAEVLELQARLNEPSTPSQAKYMQLSRKVRAGTKLHCCVFLFFFCLCFFVFFLSD